jgi:putative ubiquitin-RnfH superfamily antitoxin RatB of RatAB toxin-antitoxin module
MRERIRVSVVYADPQRQIERVLEVAASARAGEAIRASGILDELPGYTPAGIGIFGTLARPDTPLHDGDRIELYRPLRVDPKEARRKRASG